MASVHLSRRAWLAIAGGVVAAGAAAVVSRSGLPDLGRGPAPAGPPTKYVDHDGWMLTLSDKQRLAQPGPPVVQSP